MPCHAGRRPIGPLARWERGDPREIAPPPPVNGYRRDKSGFVKELRRDKSGFVKELRRDKSGFVKELRRDKSGLFRKRALLVSNAHCLASKTRRLALLVVAKI